MSIIYNSPALCSILPIARGKKSDEVAQGMKKNSLKKFSTPEPKHLKAASADSGASTPESDAKAGDRIKI
jgi:hypothetical protein